MGLDESTKDVFFELPDSMIKGIPLTANDELLSIGFVEIGCKQTKKRSQLKNKRELFYKF